MSITSISFPNMFNSTSTNLVYDNEATLTNLKLLISSEKGELFCDPYFGSIIKQYMFEQNDNVLRDILIDDLYVQIATFMPQLQLNRRDITIIQSGSTLTANIKVLNKLDYTIDTYNLVLFQDEGV